MSGLPAPMAALLDEIQVVVNHFALDYDTGILIQSFAFGGSAPGTPCHTCELGPCECPAPADLQLELGGEEEESLSSSSSD